MTVTVYARPACVQCVATYRALDKAGVDYEVVDISEDPVARDYLMALGYLQAPVVVSGNDHWSGFRPDRIRQTTSTLTQEPPSQFTSQPRHVHDAATAEREDSYFTEDHSPTPNGIDGVTALVEVASSYPPVTDFYIEDEVPYPHGRLGTFIICDRSEQ